jgi:hypothetical protein
MKKLINILGISGSTLGIFAGIIEASIGKMIKPWIGNKEEPLVLGIITIVLSLIGLISTFFAYKKHNPSNEYKIATLLGILLPSIICFTTVGRLWYLPGLILIITCIFIVYEYWFNKEIGKTSKGTLQKNNKCIYQLIGCIGSLIIIIAFGLAFVNSNFSLFQSQILINGTIFRYEVLPMDFVRTTNISTQVITDIENSIVRIIYILLILGAAIIFIASLLKSIIFKIIGCLLVFISLSLLIICMPTIFLQTNLPTIQLHNILCLLGIDWYLSIVGMLLIVTSIFFEQKNKKNINNNNILSNNIL